MAGMAEPKLRISVSGRSPANENMGLRSRGSITIEKMNARLLVGDESITTDPFALAS